MHHVTLSASGVSISAVQTPAPTAGAVCFAQHDMMKCEAINVNLNNLFIVYHVLHGHDKVR
jgi:hypothetical protein